MLSLDVLGGLLSAVLAIAGDRSRDPGFTRGGNGGRARPFSIEELAHVREELLPLRPLGFRLGHRAGRDAGQRAPLVLRVLVSRSRAGCPDALPKDQCVSVGFGGVCLCLLFFYFVSVPFGTSC